MTKMELRRMFLTMHEHAEGAGHGVSDRTLHTAFMSTDLDTDK